MPCYYNAHNVIPAPRVVISKEFVRTEDGKPRRKFFNITARGTLVAVAGSPRSNGQWWDGGIANPPPNEVIPINARLDALKNKQGALIELFNTQNKLFEIHPYNGSSPIKFIARVKNIEFAEGQWVDKTDYTISMEADNVWFGDISGGGGIDGVEPEESWSIEAENQETRSYRVSHTVSSQQKAEFDENGVLVKAGWEVAKDVVSPRVGQPLPDGLLPPVGDYYANNYSRSVQVDEANGRFSVTENYVFIWNQRYKEEFTVEIRSNESQVRVTVSGTITGFAEADFSKSPDQVAAEKFANAQTAWNSIKLQLFSRAQLYSGVTLNPLAVSTSNGFQPKTGVITYGYEWDNRPAALVSGSLSETVTVQNSDPTDVFASLVVLGRDEGPVLQPIGTKTAKQRSVSIEIVMPPATYGSASPTEPNVDAVVNSYYPGGQCLVTRNERVWVARSGRFSRNVSWTYEL